MRIPVEIRRITPEQTYVLRHAVLWPDKPLDYVKVENDAAGHHFGAFCGQELVSVISLFVEEKQARFRKFATAPEWQKQGIGSQLLQRVIEEARQLGASALWCDARQDAAAFYRRFGMTGEEPVFYKGDIPYQRMSVGL
ncbi:GNAT family N-acetyltransferase [Hymenobacter cellulosivorans]|uniref:GNAT family N-acetyltransferase n=1 Tax=Hymenobacter cellulosivorans TaxID=2932249 RepID=A0ABY4F987_9BACT|nr:GNAT family N-acetyltransferase [Hymenobacter cellulosivorans]UOQ53228.1 GNAT family N-acetyltransferase [Hymenobacter cellulosivorans]